jgi:hypothetical protein
MGNTYATPLDLGLSNLTAPTHSQMAQKPKVQRQLIAATELGHWHQERFVCCSSIFKGHSGGQDLTPHSQSSKKTSDISRFMVLQKNVSRFAVQENQAFLFLLYTDIVLFFVRGISMDH